MDGLSKENGDQRPYEDTCCYSCEEGKNRECPHYFGRHYDVWGEGISCPDYCPQRVDELPW